MRVPAHHRQETFTADLRTPDENTQVGQRAPGLAASPRCPGPCTTLPAPRLCLRHASMSRLLRTCVVDSLTHAQRRILPASAPVLSLRRLPLRRIHAAPPTEPHAFAPCGCTCSYAPPRCATSVRRYTHSYATRQALRRLTSVLVYMWEGMDGRVRGRGGRNLKRGDCVADRAPIAPSCTRAAAASGTYTLREREGHRPRLQGTAIRVAPSWHSALSQHRETRSRCARVPPVPKWNWRCRADRCVKCSAEQVQ